MKTKLTNIAMNFFKEFASRMPWRFLVERLLTRLALWALYKLAGKPTNDLKEDTVADFAAALKGKRLPAAGPERPG